MLLNLSFILAADGPGDRFIIGESQAGEQVRAHIDTLDTYTLFLSSQKKSPKTHARNNVVSVTQTPTHPEYENKVLHFCPSPSRLDRL